MDQQFEHLSDAQVEHYGEPDFVAGTNQERAPDWDPKDGDQKIAAHLDECPSCRMRVLASMRSRLALSTDKPLITAARPDCPSEDDLRNLAAGLCPPEMAPTLTDHAATCDHCGPILRMYTEDFQVDFAGAAPSALSDEALSATAQGSEAQSKEDRAVLAKLKSSSEGWQKKLVRELQSSSAGELHPNSDRARSGPARSGHALPWPRRLFIPAVAAACAAIAFFVWYSQRETPEKVEKLLAQAYTERRTIEMRIPYAAHADFKQTRSGESASLLNSPAALRKAADVIAINLKKNPDDPQWLLLSARFDLLDWRYKSALTTLSKIDDVKLADSSEFRMAQSLALYEKAEIEHDPQSYGQVVDLLGKTLQESPNDPVALFNQAVACEKLYMYECASGDYEHFLKIDPNSGWSAEAREHLNRIKEKKTLGR